MATTNVTMRMDAKVKSQLQELMADLGLDLTTYFTIAAKQAIREQRIPFEISRDNFNAETLEAFREVEEMKKNPSMVKSYSCFEDLLKEIEGECIE